MKYLHFDLSSIPDLTLSKYGSLDQSGVKGVLNKHLSFLRQLNRKGILSKVHFHLLYEYDPKKEKGHRLDVSLIASGESESLIHVEELIQNSPLGPFYSIGCNQKVKIKNIKFDPLTDSITGAKVSVINHLGQRKVYEITNKTRFIGDYFKKNKKKDYFRNIDLEKTDFYIKTTKNEINEISSEAFLNENGLKYPQNEYDYFSALSKKEFFVKPSIIMPDDNNLEYYRISDWEMDNTARLYNMFQLMNGFNIPVAFRVDLFSVDYTERIRQVLPVEELRRRTSIRANRSSAGVQVNRDENAEETLKQYNDLIEKFENSPHFRINIVAFANERDLAELIVDSSGAEAIESGSYSIKTFDSKDFSQKFNYATSINQIVNTSSNKVVDYLKFLCNLFTLEEVAPFFVFPALYDGENLEIPKETAPNFVRDGLKLAVDEYGYDVIFPIDLFKKHAFLAGVPGSGKTNSMLHLTSSLWKQHKIPFLIFEPAKNEYRALARTEGLEDLLIFSPSSGTHFPLHINPFEFPKGMSLSEHIRNLMAVFEGAFSLAPPAPFLIDFSIEAIYRDKGWYPDTINDGTLPYPTMQELYDKLEVEVEKTDYEGEIKGNLKSVLQVRIGSLLRREMGDVFNVKKSTMSPEEWLNTPALIELEAMGSGPANFLSLLLSTLIRESLKITPTADGKDLRHVIFFEEAHNLIGPNAEEVTGEDADPKMAATAFVVKMLAEVRALHEGIVIADQLPTVMAPEVIKNTGLKIGHRITAEDDRELLGSTMSASGMQLEQMATFLPGESLITFEGLLRPFKAQICQWEDGTASYDPPTNMELVKLLEDKKGYQSLLKRSATIMGNKFTDDLKRLKEQTNNLLKESAKDQADHKRLAQEFQEKGTSIPEVRDNPDTQNPELQQQKKKLLRYYDKYLALDKKINENFSNLEELIVKEKGYYIQNPLYKKRTGLLLLETSDIRTQFFNAVKDRHRNVIDRYNEFNQEVKGWNLDLSSAYE